MLPQLVSAGGVSVVLTAMGRMTLDETVQATGCGILGNSLLLDQNVVRLGGMKSASAALTALEQFTGRSEKVASWLFLLVTSLSP